jgi:LuxR family transcriptional regulator, maltose regulon positive regulatory protein
LPRGRSSRLAVADWIGDRELRETDPPSYPREREQLVLARLLLARGLPQRALPLLDRLHAAAVTQGRFSSALEARAVQALAFEAAAETASALEALADALSLAEPEGYVSVFADEGAAMTDLLRKLVSSAQRGHLPTVGSEVVEYALRLLGAVSGYRASSMKSLNGATRALGAAVLVEPLTERGAEVLMLLAEGRASQEIADRLVVTIDTVKKHLTHIFGKLDAVSRTQAVARARELNLLS